MTQKLISSFLLGFVLYLFLDFLLFIGIKINYIDLYHIKVYYNILFVDNQNYILMLLLSLLFGYLFMTKKSAKGFSYLYIGMIVLSLSTLYKPIGKGVAEYLFRKNNLLFRYGKVKFKGDLLYKGRDFVYIYRKDIGKVIKLNSIRLHFKKAIKQKDIF